MADNNMTNPMPLRLLSYVKRPWVQGGHVVGESCLPLQQPVEIDGVRYAVPAPIIDLGDGVVAVPKMTATEGPNGPAARIDLHVWDLFDVDRGRSLHITVKQADAKLALRVADRYRREARQMPDVAIPDWAASTVQSEVDAHRASAGGRVAMPPNA